ncbi:MULTISPECIES: hypothetical protein [Kamptonema]|nr:MULTISPECIES: hypothetical protein [Kamptonema]
MKESRAAIANIHLPPDEPQLEATPVAYSAYLSADFEGMSPD